MLNKLYQFQKEGIEFAARHHGRILLGDEMGVGKTVQALAMSYLYKEDWPLLILTPASLKLNWRDEILTWLTDIPPSQVEVVQNSKKGLKEKKLIHILSYDLAKNIEATLSQKTFNIVIADEVHYLKNRDAKRTKILAPLMKQCKRIFLLSGTPMLSKPLEIFVPVQILRPDIFKVFRAFGNRYCNPKPTPFGIDWTGSSCPGELHQILQHIGMIRRLKKDVLSQLPPKTRQKIEIQTDKKKVKEVKAILEHLNVKERNMLFQKENMMIGGGEGEGGQEKESSTIGSAYIKSGEAKQKGICEFVSMLLESKTKFLIFAHHLLVLDFIEETVKKNKWKPGYIRIDGSINANKRHELISKYQKDEHCKIAILGLTASSQGITLTASSTVVFAEMHWTPGNYELIK